MRFTIRFVKRPSERALPLLEQSSIIFIIGVILGRQVVLLVTR